MIFMLIFAIINFVYNLHNKRKMDLKTINKQKAIWKAKELFLFKAFKKIYGL